MHAITLFILAGLAEIGGGYLVWLWLRENKPLWYGIIGGIILVVYGTIPTLQKFPSFGRVYAAFGGLFCYSVRSLGWGIDKKVSEYRLDWGSDLFGRRFDYALGTEELKGFDRLERLNEL